MKQIDQIVDAYEAKTINYEDIDFGKRKRIEYGDVFELSKNIEAVGLMSRVIVVPKSFLSDADTNDVQMEEGKPYLLLAGGRRMKALNLLRVDNVPCNVAKRMLNEAEIREIELYENIFRLDLTDSERISMTGDIHELWTKKFGEKKSTTPNAPGHSIKDTAAMLKRPPTSVARDLRMNQLMKKLGIQKGAKVNMKTVQKAVNAATSKLAAVKAKDAADVRMSQLSKEIAGFQSSLAASYKVGDALVECAALPNESFDLIEIDPPFAQDLDINKSTEAATLDEYTEVRKEEYERFMRSILATSFDKAKPDAWLLCWFAPYPWYADVARWIAEAGWKIRPIPIIWIKETGQTNQPGMYLATNMEMCFYARKGNAKIVKQGHNSTYEYRTVSAARKIHATEKPANMLLELFGTFVHENSNILIPFLGSGASILAASDMGCTSVGFDLSETHRNRFIGERVTLCEPRRCASVQFLSLQEVKFLTESRVQAAGAPPAE